MSDEPPVEAKYKALRRGLRSRRRDDHALDLFRRIETNLSDVGLVDRVLLELSRCYNPLTNGPIVDLATRRAIIESLRAGRAGEARRLLDECLARYAPPAEAPRPASSAEPGELPLPGQPS
ncbi:MAG: hypothetical protein DMD98_03850 [Candidatus Rokuibacteriota bacterium]|nr:MAG: hypothetical protein AUH14_08990 [Candidatus Rokubacteria bacterium 13_2_20CM_69_15_1]PYN38528.1 MAG: hypothetical protein DMD98_03850 [Candidatus Rokubacteria bacterium]